jgi:alpha-tubulin suppressor-like RCC1 family protein
MRQRTTRQLTTAGAHLLAPLRAGHPDWHIHSGQSAQILPRVVAGLGRRAVACVAAAKHHTLVATSSGEVFSWGSNKDGRLGYAAGDTQPTPRK